MLTNFKRRIISLILIFALCISSAVALTSCSMGGGSGEQNGGGDFAPDLEASEDSGKDYHDKIIAPQYKEYPRNTVKFEEMEYKRPDFDAVIGAFSDVIDLIEKKEISYDEQLAKVEELEVGYGNILTMYSLSNIYNSKDSSSQFWSGEFSYVSRNYPTFAGIVEDLFVAAANSPYAESFEEYFGDDLIEEYRDGGNLTDEIVALWAEEERLEAEYSSISTATIEVSYRDKTDTVDNILSEYLEKYGENSIEYLTASSVCLQEYEKMADEFSRDLLIELIKIRRLIANELGLSSYMDYAYDSYGRDYTPAQMDKFYSDVASYVVPVYASLASLVFYSYFQTNLPSSITLDTLINETYYAIDAKDKELSDIYNYMLLYELFDIELGKINRESGAFTAYLDDYEAPFIFISASGNVTDYSTLIHEFGHFADAYINDNSSTSIDQKEISSQALEYLMLTAMADALNSKDLQYLTYVMMSEALETLIYQGFYGKLEKIIYSLPYDEITAENLNAAVVSAAELFGLNTDYVNDISVAFIPHIFIYPFYVQSYCTSILPSLEMYFKEVESVGSGFEAYRTVIDRTESDLDFIEAITAAGLTSPFSDGAIRDIANDIYYAIVGMRYYIDDGASDGAA